MVVRFYPKKRRRDVSPLPHPLLPMPPRDLQTGLNLVPSLPMTPPDPDAEPLPSFPAAVTSLSSIDTVLHVISTERAALDHLERFYSINQPARYNMGCAVHLISSTIHEGGKLVVCGVGKSGKIGEKIVATMNSLGINSTFLHPTEALHGDLGMINQNDTLLFITFSGKTSELLLLLPHLCPTVSVIVMTAHTEPATCALLADANGSKTILLPSPVHECETVSFGVAAPTTSTTVALALGDALALAVARRLHTTPGRGPADVFKSFHPGGAIGAAVSASSGNTTPTSNSSYVSSTPPTSVSNTSSRSQHTTSSDKRYITDLATPFRTIPQVSVSELASIRVIDVLRAALRSPAAKGWVLVSANCIIPPHQTVVLANWEEPSDLISDIPGFKPHIGINTSEWIQVSKDKTVEEVRCLLREVIADHDNSVSNTKRKTSHSGDSEKENRLQPNDCIISIVDDFTGHIVGVVDIKDVLSV
ncbi:hypothetical protein FQN57_000603 [Myotisia sp. PD_48]|nr:hypothetical protein FQN57_000603 [Myotisia sp. PD_48]